MQDRGDGSTVLLGRTRQIEPSPCLVGGIINARYCRERQKAAACDS